MFDNNPQAFPQLDYYTVESATEDKDIIVYKQNNGMTLRDYFAGQCLTAIALREITPDSLKDITKKAYIIADGMMEARLNGER